MPTTTAADDNWFIYEGPPSTHTAELSGVLHINVEAHCVMVDDTWAVFPEETSLDLADPERPGLVLPGGYRVYSGDRVELGGGGTGSLVAGASANCGPGQNFAVG
jgi:hypothetical protein